jgi:hypothetical protein
METKIRNKAKEEMESEAIANGILQVANKNAIKDLAKLFNDMNIKIR